MHHYTLIFVQNLMLLAFMLHCAIVGFALNNSLSLWPEKAGSRNSNAYLQGFFAISVGLMVNVTLLFLLGMAGWLTKPAVFGALGLALAVATAGIVRSA